MKIQIYLKIFQYTNILLLLSLVIAGCSTDRNPQHELREGLTRQEVREVLGEPDVIKDFVIPEAPFFGPQEGLGSLVPAGGMVEEWRYDVDNDVMYVWFYGEPSQGREEWKVIGTTMIPKDAVFEGFVRIQASHSEGVVSTRS